MLLKLTHALVMSFQYCSWYFVAPDELFQFTIAVVPLRDADNPVGVGGAVVVVSSSVVVLSGEE